MEVHALLARVTDVWSVTLPDAGEFWATATWPNVPAPSLLATAATSSTRRLARLITSPRGGGTACLCLWSISVSVSVCVFVSMPSLCLSNPLGFSCGFYCSYMRA